jgi:hypothetical protein
MRGAQTQIPIDSSPLVGPDSHIRISDVKRLQGAMAGARRQSEMNQPAAYHL